MMYPLLARPRRSRLAATPASRRCALSPARRRVNTRSATAVTLVLVLLAGAGQVSAQVKDRVPPEVARLDAYLARLGLAGLRIRNLERELQRSGAGPAAPAIAGRLAEVFADRLLTAGDSKEGAELTDRLTRLISAHPSTATPRVRLTLLEGDYNRAEAEALKWVGDPSNGPARANAVARLGRCRPELDRIRDDLLKQIEKTNDELGRLDNGPRRDALEREFQVGAQVANRATYFAGWANFYESVVTQLPAAASERLRVARQGFRRLLGIEPERFKSSDLEGLDGELTARIALGLALVEMASGGTENGNEVFQSLRGPSVNATVRDWVDRWQVWALARAGLVAEAEATARSAVEGFAPPLTPAKGALCSMLIRGVSGAAETSVPGPAGAGGIEQANRLTLLGLRGLIRLGRPDLQARRSACGGRDLSAAAPCPACWPIGCAGRPRFKRRRPAEAPMPTRVPRLRSPRPRPIPPLPASRSSSPIAGSARPGAFSASAI